ncbi:hypothetical protein CYY_007979 [Polysphondylium violaceum]|uniref:Polymorphic outer membrane protein n=1 Tax=Polysphondylium violaceum TaxID=133409 RepID=A0A8J4PNK5_9MYCE|nr:hypothetical protein CYY_007979 [Polysphondylium violaceum]
MKGYILYFVLFIYILLDLGVEGADNGLTLFVNPTAKTPNQDCGATIDLACKTIGQAINSYDISNKGDNSIPLLIQLMDGVYGSETNAVVIDSKSGVESVSLQSWSNNSANVVLYGSTLFFSYTNSSNTVNQQTISFSNVTLNSTLLISSLDSSCVSVTFSDCVFENINTAPPVVNLSYQSGGASQPSFIIKNSMINTFANRECPAFQVNNYAILLDTVSFNNNSVQTMFTLSNSEIQITSMTMNSVNASLSPFTINNSNVSVSDSTFNLNKGALVGVFDIQSNNTTKSTMNRCTFYKNQGYSGAGSISLKNSLTPVFLNCNFTGNVAIGNGGAININNANDVNIGNTLFSTNVATQLGGALYLSSGQGSVSGSQFLDNSSFRGGGIGVLNSTLQLTSDTFNQNYGAINGQNIDCTLSSLDISASTLNTLFKYQGIFCPAGDCKVSGIESNSTCPSNSSSSSSHSNNDNKNHDNGLSTRDKIIIGATSPPSPSPSQQLPSQ